MVGLRTAPRWLLEQRLGRHYAQFSDAVVAAQLVSQGDLIAALALLTMFVAYLRPGEALKVRERLAPRMQGSQGEEGRGVQKLVFETLSGGHVAKKAQRRSNSSLRVVMLNLYSGVFKPLVSSKSAYRGHHHPDRHHHRRRHRGVLPFSPPSPVES